jgi:hypothetical protein
MASADFVKIMEKKKEAAALMKSLSQAEAGGKFTLPTIDDGKYIFNVKADCGVTPNKGIPYVNLKWTIADDSAFNDKGSDKTFYLDSDDIERTTKTYASLGRDFKTLLDTDELDVNTPADIAALVDAVNEESPYVAGALKNWEKGEKSGFNVYFNERVEVAQ